MRVLVIGGSGFVGSSVCAALREAGDEVVCADAVPPRPFSASLLDGIPFHHVLVQDFHDVIRVMWSSRPDAVIYLSYVAGAASEADPFGSSVVNLQGPMNCVEAAGMIGVRRVVYASSIGVYGPDQDYYGERELSEQDSCPISQHSLSYSAGKAINEFLMTKLAVHHSIDICHVRLSIVFGHGREHGFTTWASDIGSAPAVGAATTLPFHPDQRSSLIYVDDAARLLASAARLHQPGATVYNSGGHTVRMCELADAVTAIEPSARIAFDRNAAPQPFVSRVSAAHAEEHFGFRLTPLDAALRLHMDTARVAHGLEPGYAAA